MRVEGKGECLSAGSLVRNESKYALTAGGVPSRPANSDS